ncbi:hypothetical protein KX729_33160 [Rhizobium sp. XQZ8]|uniref:hypothetical protein n=1 Tax=Rhizobium populisoli TaxID=2859785 RepID=UPI001CA51020|nr:hypothetical protein [Rhizobium populisoli]MBW6426196.1 hypothetical protein [Rhizobium populisoli]
MSPGVIPVIVMAEAIDAAVESAVPAEKSPNPPGPRAAVKSVVRIGSLLAHSAGTDVVE